MLLHIVQAWQTEALQRHVSAGDSNARCSVTTSLQSAGRRTAIQWTCVALLALAPPLPRAQAQEDDSAFQQERAVADRFMQVLMKRPRLGTALDRVYGFHVRNGSLEELIASLDVEDGADDAGAKAMILGLVQLQRGKPALAAEALALAEGRLPEDAVCCYYLGRAHLAVGQTEQAAAAMERAIDRGPARNEALPVFTELGRIYGRAGLNDKALDVWTRLEELFPGDDRVGGQIARTLAEEGNNEEAIKRYAKLATAARREEDRIAFAVQAAEMKRRLGQGDEAVEDLEAILGKLRPGSWLYTDVRNRIEDGFLKSGDFDALAGYYQSRLDNDADNLELRTRLGRILVSAGRLDQAQQTLQDAAERAPDDADVRLALIDVLLSKDDVAGAAGHFEQLAERDPENPDYLLRWGQILLDDPDREPAQRQDAAAKIWQRLADARGDDAVTLAQVADRMRSVERADEAVALYRKAIEVDPTSSQYREYLGEYMHQLGRQNEAIEVWNSIAEGDRRNRDSLVRLAEVFTTFELPEKSIAAWKEAADLDLTFAQELRFAKALRDAKQFDDALKRLDVAEAIAETPDERDQLLADRIATFGQAGTLAAQISELKPKAESADQLRQLAMMHQAAGQLTDAAAAIKSATEKAPQSVPVLIVAADVAERQNRFADAAELFRKLSSVDPRYQTNYLQRVANLQTRLGQIDDALATCEDLIDANPASTESYQFYARTALNAGRDEQAIEALRRAMNVARRDNGPRNMLASTFADRYRTDEAVDLYWQALDFETKSDDRIAVIRRLAPLYDRKGDLDTLIQRIEDLGREDNDVRTTQLMISAAHEAIQDYGAARQALDRLLARQPRDVALLEEMVRLCDLADEIELAAEFQQRVAGLADTPENRFKLVQLKLDAGMIDAAAALSERVSLTSDPVRLGRMIRSAATRFDTKSAIAICEEAIRSDPDLWDVKLYLAQLLLYETGEEAETAHARALQLTEEIRQADVALDAPAPTTPPPNVSQQQLRGLPANYYTSPQRWTRIGYELARAYRLGRYASSTYSSSYGQGNSIIQPSSFGHAKVLARALSMTKDARGKSGRELTETLERLMKEDFALPPIEQITDPGVLWERQALWSFVSYIDPEGQKTRNVEDDPERQALMWRLAKVDPENGSQLLTSMLMQRLQKNRGVNLPAGFPTSPAGDDQPLEPLTDEQLDIVVRTFDDLTARQQGNAAALQAMQSISYRAILKNEFELAGQPQRAAEFEPQPPPEDADFSALFSTITFHLNTGEPERAEGLVDRLLPAVRKDVGGTGGAVAHSSITGSFGGLAQNGDAAREFVERHQVKLLDAQIASVVKGAAGAQSRSSRSSLSNGTAQAYYQRTPGGGYYSMQVKAPLSPDLFNPTLVVELAGLFPPDTSQGDVRNPSLAVPDEIITHLEAPLPDAPPQELKTRRALGAFAHWWADRPEKCFEGLVKLCEEFPDDVDLQIERARLASELGQPRVALEALDSFDPLDSNMLVRKEMAAMNLAAQLGDVARASQAAERLFGMRMDTNTQLALADQLRRLGMKDKASAMLRRLRGGRARDESTEMQIANAFLSAGDQEAAAEVAYALLRRLGSGRGRSTSNVDYYRRQAVEILESAGRLDGLIERAERRLKSAPKSTRARSELAELYTAAGRADDANKLWEDVADERPNDPRQLLARAEALVKAKQHKQAMLSYLDAFEKQPQLFSSKYYDMTRAAAAAKAEDEMFKRLLTFDPNSIPYSRVDDMMRLGNRNQFSDAKREFLVHSLKSDRVRGYLHRITQYIPESERESIPELREAMLEAVCGDDSFSPSSSIWRVSSRSSGGTANGPLEGVVKLLRSNEEARARFDEAAATALQDKTQAPTARMLTAVIDVHDSEKRNEAVQVIRELVTQAEENQENSKPPANRPPQISGGLLWQSGQILENTPGIEDRPSLLVALYETAARDPSTSPTGDLRFSIVHRLINAYQQAGRTGDARRYLLDAYAAVDNTSQNQYNPGYGDYQDLESWKGIADKLVELECPIDGLAVYYRGLEDPGKFERARRWGGSSNTEESFRKAAQSAADKITSKAAVAHLNRLADDLADGKRAPAVSLLDLPLSILVEDDLQPGLALAIETAAETDPGREALGDFAKKLDELAADRPDDWSVPAARLMIGAKLEPNAVPELAETLNQRLPKVETVSAAEGTPDALQYRPLLDLYTPTSFVMQLEDEQARTVGEELAAYVTSVAKAVGDPDAQLAISSLSGNAGDSLAGFIDAIQAVVEPGATLSKAQFNTAMRVATTAATAGDVALSARALKLALRNGPPLRQIGVSGGDAFAITRTSSSVLPAQQDDGMTELTASVLELLDVWSDATGQKLGAREPDDDFKPQQPVDRAAALQEVADALRTIVLPEARQDSVFPYAAPIASTTSYDRFGSDGITAQSASIALGRVAASVGQSEDLIAALRKRLNGSADKSAVAGVLIDVALAAGDMETLASALELFDKELGEDLPAESLTTKKFDRLRSISSQMQRDSFRKSQIVNQVMQSVWPVATHPKLPDDVAAHASELLGRTVTLINSDAYTSQRHREISQRIERRSLKNSANSGDETSFGKTLKSLVRSIDARYAGYPPDSRATYRKRSMESLLGELSSDGHIVQSHGFIRQLIEHEMDAGRDFQAIAPAAACLEIATLPKGEQLDLLLKITLGEADDDPMLHWGSLVRYEVPPPMVQLQTTRLREVQNLPTCDPDFPVADTILMLADVAAELGKSEDVAGRLAARSTRPGDDADVAAALVKLAARSSDSPADLEPLEPTLDAIAEDLAKDRPSTNDETLAFPALSSYLVLRSLRAGLPATAAAPLLDDLKAYAICSRRTMMASAISRVQALNGIGRAAGGTTASPLTHFTPVALPQRTNPDAPMLAPLFAVDKDGWLSGTGGYGMTLLLLKYPLVGSFTVSAQVKEERWGVSDVSYGGVLYQPIASQKRATVRAPIGGSAVKLPVPSIEFGQVNEETLRISPDETVGLVNGEPYVSDLTAASFPWAGVSHRLVQTSRLREIKITGDVTIPREVNLIHTTMRGWGTLTYGQGLPDPLLPTGPKQNVEEIRQRLREAAEQVENALPEAKWSVRDGELHYTSATSSNAYDPSSHLQYLRPLLEGESVQFSFWWERGETEFRPTVGRVRLELYRLGTRPVWIQSPSDLTNNGYIGTTQPNKLAGRMAPDVVPDDHTWNTVTLRRRGDLVVVLLNDTRLTEVPANDNTRFGIDRPAKKDTWIRSITLTGDWPEKLPDDLMQQTSVASD